MTTIHKSLIKYGQEVKVKAFPLSSTVNFQEATESSSERKKATS
jgi:hypothetical protein